MFIFCTLTCACTALRLVYLKRCEAFFLEYKLVIICSSEYEYKSPMISALDKYRAPKITVAGDRKIKEYLKKKYAPANVSESAIAGDSIG